MNRAGRSLHTSQLSTNSLSMVAVSSSISLIAESPQGCPRVAPGLGGVRAGVECNPFAAAQARGGWTSYVPSSYSHDMPKNSSLKIVRRWVAMDHALGVGLHIATFALRWGVSTKTVRR